MEVPMDTSLKIFLPLVCASTLVDMFTTLSNI